MLQRAWHHLGPVAGILALVIALGAPSWAAAKIHGKQIKKETITSQQVKNGSLTGADLRDTSLSGADVKDASLTGADLAAGAVGSADLAAGAVTTSSFAGTAVAPSAGALPGLRPGDFAAAGGTPGPLGDFSIAVGRRAQAPNTGSFVWADSAPADFSSTADNQVAFRAANGLVVANDAGPAATVPVGTRFRDNAVIAWARVAANGNLDTGFNVASITKVGIGHYKVNLGGIPASGFTLIPAVTPEVDDVSGVPPVGAANIRFAVTNQFASGASFDVFMYNGSFALVDNDFQFLATGR